jgi:hypothetical protein
MVGKRGRIEIEMMLAVFVSLVCGLSALLYLVTRTRGPLRGEEERGKNEGRVERDIPPPPG